MESAIAKLWYNTPIFYGNSKEDPVIFQSLDGSITYGGKTPTEKILREAKEIISENYFSLLILIFMFLIPIVLFIALVNWVVRKKS